MHTHAVFTASGRCEALVTGDVANAFAIPDDLRDVPQSRLVRLDGEVRDAADVSTWYVDGSGERHPTRADTSWAAVSAVWDAPLKRDGDIWTVETDADQLATARNRAVQQIAVAANAATQPLLQEYPTAERETWRKQEDEARAVLAGTLNASDAEFLMLLTGGVYQGVRPLAEKVVAKADRFKEIAARVIAIRKAATEAVDDADDAAAIEAALFEARAALEAVD